MVPTAPEVVFPATLQYFNGAAISFYIMGLIEVIVIYTGTIISYWKRIEHIKISMICLAIYVFMPTLKRQEFLSVELPEEHKVDTESGFFKFQKVFKPIEKMAYIMFNNYLLYETIEGNLMFIIMASF